MNASLNSDIYKAWVGFVNEGIILDGLIRTEIVESWQRSRGIDPFAKHRHQLPNRMLQAKLAENVQLISLARPITRDISEVGGLDFVALSDQDGYIIDVAGNPQYYELLGLSFREIDIGTNAIGTALVEDKGFEVKGSEHYCNCYHTAFGQAIPIHNISDTIIGILAVYNLSRPLPGGILQTMKLGVKVIENQIEYKSQQSEITHIYHNTCSSIIDFLVMAFLWLTPRTILLTLTKVL
jgi:transcriptional regulator of acetoin/glycerol metabolism